jgi:hypothetical protein
MVKNGSGIEVVGDEVVATIRILKSGQAQVEAPTIPPQVLSKMLFNLIVELMYASFQPAEVNRIQPPTM